MTNTLYDALIAPHRSNDSPFLITDSGNTVSFADFVRRAAQIAHALQKNGVTPGDRVVVRAPKVSETLALYAATIQVGAIYLPLNNAYTAEELTYFINDASPTVFVCEDCDVDAMTPICDGAGAKILTLNADGSGTLTDAADGQSTDFETVSRGPDDLAALLYTSGTTGRSKGAMLSHKNLLSNAQALTELWGITSADRLIHALPIFHTHGLFVAMNTSLLAGTQVRFMGKFDLDMIFDEIPKSTLMMGVPTFYTRMLGDDRLTKDLVKGMRLFVSGSAPLLEETHEAFEARTGQRILERYGMTETNMIASNPYDGARIAGTVGFPIGNAEVQVTDPDNGNPLPAGDIGMIEVRGDNVFKGYWNMPEKTKEELRDNGFFITGDLGVLDDEGRLSIVGRAKDLIISGGYNIYPKEIEDVLNEAPGVVESAVFGVPHPDFGEAVVAAMVMECRQADDAPLKDFIAPKLARFKQPKTFVFLDELPRNTMGKVQKNILRDQHGR